MPLTATAITLFRTDANAITKERLLQYAFQPIDERKSEELSFGWVNIDDAMDTQWLTPPEKGEWVCFSFRMDKRSVPGAVLKKHYDEALREEIAALQAQGQTIARSRRKELKDAIKAKLLSKAEPVPSVVDIAVNYHSGLMLVGTVSKGVLEKFTEYYQNSFGVSPTPVQAKDDMASAFLALYDGGLEARLDEHTYALSEGGLITLVGVDADNEESSVTAKNDRAAVDAALEKGMGITKMKVLMARSDDDALAWSFVLDSTLAIAGLKTPAANSDDDNNPDGALLEKLYLVEQVAGVVCALFEER